MFSKKVKAPKLNHIDLMTAYGPRLDVFADLVRQRDDSRKSFDRARQYGTEIPGLITQLGQAPTLGAPDVAEYQNAEGVYRQMLNLAKTNSINNTVNETNSAAFALGLKGINSGDSGANRLFSSIAARNQGSLNEYAGNTANNLLQFRERLLSGVYQRLTNKYNATVSQRAAELQTGSGLFSNVFNALSSERAYQAETQQANAQMKLAADTANAQSKSSGMSSIMSSVAAIGGAAMMAFSDTRLKENIEEIGTLPNKIKVYKYNYIWETAPQIGVMAQQVQGIMPNAVKCHTSGYYMVDYSQILEGAE